MDGHNAFLRRLDHPKQDSLMKPVFKLQKQGLVRTIPFRTPIRFGIQLSRHVAPLDVRSNAIQKLRQ